MVLEHLICSQLEFLLGHGLAIVGLVDQDKSFLSELTFYGDPVLASVRLHRKLDSMLALSSDNPWREDCLAHILRIVVHQHVRLSLH